MPLRSALFSQSSLLLTLLLLLGCGFLATSLVSYYASRSAIRDGIINTELPLTSDTVYSEIQKDLIRPIVVSSMLAQNTLLRDWTLAGEHDPEVMTRYLSEVERQQRAYTAFYVSEASGIYYQAKGILKKIDPSTPRDLWYARVKQMQAPYEINVDMDMANKDRMTVFINYKVLDEQNRFMGAAGVGLTVDAVVRLIDAYQLRYKRSVYFVDPRGQIVLTGSTGGPEGARPGTTLQSIPSLAGLVERMPTPSTGSREYQRDDQLHFLNVRFIPELDWYLFVEKPVGASLDGVKQSLYLNLAICAIISAVVLAMINGMVRRHQDGIQELATLDSLTHLHNRRAFDLLAAQALLDAERGALPLTAVLIDLDHFKELNDTHGHLAGDEVLRQFARLLEGSLRQADILCRWGGEEFVVLLKDTELAKGMVVAEKIRQRTERSEFTFDASRVSLTASFGVTGLAPGDTLRSLIARADQALYRAKQSGRNRVCSEPASPEHA
ncbi:sensor domain-containing diguanylate cyclase [Pseudomonas putida]|uniref:diguanylate cyclase n=1 Tax=Pseudomonas putida TaxID=303 RepID=A0A177SLI7_PSEPU|nr:sensor domain-containing diguanylate cyclase [Pseudomonas putida]OAI91404.1 diguanylate cyclase [Pseudomonas putida]